MTFYINGEKNKSTLLLLYSKLYNFPVIFFLKSNSDVLFIWKIGNFLHIFTLDKIQI